MDRLNDILSLAKGVTCDSREVKPGYIFVAVQGRSTDGNNFAPQAADRGAIAIITDKPESLVAENIPIYLVENARIALAEIAARFYGHPSRNMSLVGITGTNGKTTVSFMLKHLFTATGLKTGLIGTIHVDVGDRTIPSSLTTPDAAKLQSYLAAMRCNGITHTVMEVSAQGIEMNRIHDVSFSCGLVTNISPDHLDFHGDFTAYLAAKKHFINFLHPAAPLIVNGTDPYCRSFSTGFAGRTITVAATAPATVTAENLELRGYSASFNLTLTAPLFTIGGTRIEPFSEPVRLNIPGIHNIDNALMAATAALIHGISPQEIIAALRTFEAVPRRMNLFHLSGITVIDDTALNPGSINAVFETVRNLRFHRLIVVNAIRGCRGTAINAANAQTFSSLWHNKSFDLIITASNDKVLPADLVSAKEKSAFLMALEQHKIPYRYSDSLRGALIAALEMASSGDLLLLLGAQGMDNGREMLSALSHLYQSSTEIYQKTLEYSIQ
jgi:UDP-N-acetylmuramoyl-L-alanyl-D-glutamate--2,6-diaminopimelate ligase